MTKMATMPIYGKNLSKMFFSETSVNHDPVMTLSQFMARSTWVAQAFEWGKLLKCHLKGKTAGNWQMDRILITLKK